MRGWRAGIGILSKLHWVESGDGTHRARLKWNNNRKWNYFATVDEIKELIRELILLLKDEAEFYHRKEPEE